MPKPTLKFKPKKYNSDIKNMKKILKKAAEEASQVVRNNGSGAFRLAVR